MDGSVMVDYQAFEERLNHSLDYHFEMEKDFQLDFKFSSLDQWDTDDKNKLDAEGRPALVFDRTRPILAAVAGSEMTNRWEPRFLPRDPELMDKDIAFAESGSKIYRWIRQRSDWEHSESAAFWSSLVCGVGCTEMAMDLEEDPDGILTLGRVPIFEVLWDPDSTQPNISDGRYVIRDRWFDEDELASVFGADNVENVKDFARVQSQQSKGWLSWLYTREVDDPRSTYFDQRGRRFYDPVLHKVRTFEMQHKERRYQTRIIRPMLNVPPIPELEQLAQLGFDGGDEFLDKGQPTQDRLEELRATSDQANAMLMTLPPEMGLGMVGPIDYLEDFPVTKVYRSYHAGGEVLQEPEELPHRDFTYQFMTCFEDWSDTDSGRRKFFGMMRPMRDPQNYANKFFSQMVHIWSSNPKGAILFEESLFENPDQASEEWAKSNGFIPVADQALQSAKPRYEVIGGMNNFSGVEQLLQHAMGAVGAAAGVNEQYFVGGASDLRRTAASAVDSVREQNMVTMSQPFDNLRLYKKGQGRLVLTYMESEMQVKQMAAVLDPMEPADMMFLDAVKKGELSKEYHISVDETPTQKNKQMEVFGKLMETQFIPQMLQASIPIPPTLAKYFPLPPDITTEFEGVLSDVQETMKMQNELSKMQMQLQMMQLQQQAGMMMQGQDPNQQGGPPPGEEGGAPPPQPSGEEGF